METIRFQDPGKRKVGFGIRDPGWRKVGSGISDKHPGSATLVKTNNIDLQFGVSCLQKNVLQKHTSNPRLLREI
jgi:Holliday junction resolvasome RuvABC endonuclease subunit